MLKLSFNSSVFAGSKNRKFRTFLFGSFVFLTGLTQAVAQINFKTDRFTGSAYASSYFFYPTTCAVTIKDLNPSGTTATDPLDGFRYQFTTNCPNTSKWTRYTLVYNSTASSSGGSAEMDRLEIDLPADSQDKITKVLAMPALTAPPGRTLNGVLKIIPRFDPLGDEYWVSTWLKPNTSGNRLLNFSELLVEHGTRNIALNQPVNGSTNQSYVQDTAPGFWLGVDGRADGGPDYISASDYEPSPRYTVRVPGKMAKLTRLVFYNRTTDGLANRSDNMYFIASPYDPRVKTLAATLADPPVKSKLIVTASTSNATPQKVLFADLKVQTAAPGYYLSLWQPSSTGVTNKILNFNEVMAYNVGSTTNVALNQTTSTSLAPPTGRTAASVVDGNTTFTSTTFSSSAEASPRWTVKLPGNINDFDYLNFYNRTDCCSDRSNNMYFLLSMSNPASKSLSTVLAETGTLQYFLSKAPTTSTVLKIKRSQFTSER